MNVKIYTTPTCGWCGFTKAFFKEKHIEYKEFNVAEDHEAAHEMVAKSGQMGVPVIDIDGDVFIGFDKAGITYTLREKGVL